jgi:S-adenosylmethionine:tRNA ribosyltransferase-isomerase
VTTLDLPALDFVLSPQLEAHEPPEARGLTRDGVRLLVSHTDDDSIEHRVFLDLPDVLRPGDLLVANDSATLPAAIVAQRSDGSWIDLHFSTRLQANLWVVEPRRVTATEGELLRLPGAAEVRLLVPYAGSQRLWVGAVNTDVPSYLRRWGHPISYPYVRQRWPLEMYQTVYAAQPGSAEMPSAGRAFSANVLERLAHRGVELVTLTLHTGVASLEGHEAPYAEEYRVPPETAHAVQSAKSEGRRVIAVGTTVVRALETAADEGQGEVIAAHGWTELVITRERGVQVVDSLLTGFHEPRASHLAMLEAIAGRRHLEAAYAAALDGGYLWHEFGDLHLIL